MHSYFRIVCSTFLERNTLLETEPISKRHGEKESSDFPFIVLNGWVKCSRHQHKEGEVHAEAAPTAQPQSVPQQMVHARNF